MMNDRTKWFGLAVILTMFGLALLAIHSADELAKKYQELMDARIPSELVTPEIYKAKSK